MYDTMSIQIEPVFSTPEVGLCKAVENRVLPRRILDRTAEQREPLIALRSLSGNARRPSSSRFRGDASKQRIA